MFSLFQAVIDRVKALLTTTAAIELEADALMRHAERKAELLRLADRYEAEKLPTVAAELRRHAEAIDLQRPLVGVATNVSSIAAEQGQSALPEPRRELPDVPVVNTNGRRKRLTTSE